MSDIYFYKCNCDRKKVDKSGSLDTIPAPTSANPNGGITDTFIFKQPCSVFNPEVLIAKETLAKANFSQINYAYIPSLGRYYFVDDITMENDGILRFSMSVDVLMTYRTQILKSKQFVARSQSLDSRLYIDSERPIQANKLIKPNDACVLGLFPQSTGNNYVMTVAGG